MGMTREDKLLRAAYNELVEKNNYLSLENNRLCGEIDKANQILKDLNDDIESLGKSVKELIKLSK